MLDEKDTFGYKLMCLRKSQKMPRETLSKNIDVSVSTIIRYEKNETVPDCEVFTRMIKEFNRSPQDFLFERTPDLKDIYKGPFKDSYIPPKEEIIKSANNFIDSILNEN